MANTERAAVAAFNLALIQLLEAAGFTEFSLSDLSVNWDGRQMRLDIAHLDASGHLGEFLAAYSVDPMDLATLGTRIDVPHMGGGTTH